jgi:hypothetical protein
MATTLNAGTSTSGAAISADTTGILQLQSGSTPTTAVTIDASQVVTFAKQPVVTAAQSMIRLNTPNGWGSSSTRIRRFSTVVTSQGSDITYTTSADNSVLGCVFTINTNGVYSVSYSDCFNAEGWIGISLNSSQLSTAVQSINISDILSTTYVSINNSGNFVGWVGYLPSGSVVRPHTASASTGSNPNTAQFTITRVA